MSAEGFCNFGSLQEMGEKGDNPAKSICNHPTPVSVFKKYLDILMCNLCINRIN